MESGFLLFPCLGVVWTGDGRAQWGKETAVTPTLSEAEMAFTLALHVNLFIERD
jgi:hypothetical protein